MVEEQRVGEDHRQEAHPGTEPPCYERGNAQSAGGEAQV